MFLFSINLPFQHYESQNVTYQLLLLLQSSNILLAPVVPTDSCD
jgi:hypothetical protein